MEEVAEVKSVVSGCKDDLILHLGVALDETLYIHDLDEKAVDIAEKSNLDAKSNTKNMLPTLTKLKMSAGTLKPILVSSTVVASVRENFEMVETFESAQVLVVRPTLLSAIKGACKGDGAAERAKLRVSWAPDVYDPPVTSVSLSKPKNPYHRLSRSSKLKDQRPKNKQKTTKQIHGCSGAMKNHSGHRKHSGRCDYKRRHDLRVQPVVHVPTPVAPNRSGESSAVNLSDNSVCSPQDIKWRSSSRFVMPSLATLRYSFAEA